MSDQVPTHPEIWKAAFALAAADLRVALPARVESYDAASQTCSAQVLIPDAYVDTDGEAQTRRVAVVTRVPVLFPRSGSFGVTFPISVGDTVMLLFSSSDLDQFFALGGERDPLTHRHHNLSDAVAIPGMFASPDARTDAPTDALVVNGAVKLGDSSASDAVVLASDLAMLRQALSSATIVAGAGGAAGVVAAADTLANAASPGAVWPICSKKVKAK